MALDDVPPDEMHLLGPTRDPIDAALGGESDDPAVAALVRDLRSAYLPEGTRARSDALVAFTCEGAPAAIPARAAQPALEPPVPLGRRVAVGVAAFAATMTGKVVLGGAVAAATLGGLHAGEVVDVPLLPRSPQAEPGPATSGELPAPTDPLSVLLPPAPPAPDLDDEGTHRDAPAAVVPAPTPGSDGPAPVDPATPAEDVADPGPGTGPANPPAPAADPGPARAPQAPGEQPAPPAGQPAPPAAGPQGENPQGDSPDSEPRADAPAPDEPGDQPAPAATQQEDPPRP